MLETQHLFAWALEDLVRLFSHLFHRTFGSFPTVWMLISPLCCPPKKYVTMWWSRDRILCEIKEMKPWVGSQTSSLPELTQRHPNFLSV